MPADDETAAAPGSPGATSYWHPAADRPGSRGPGAGPASGAGPNPAQAVAGAEGVPNPSAVNVLRAVRRFRAADVAMRIRARANMELNDTDMVALRHLIAAEERSEPIGPKDLSVLLGITSAATAKLLTRLEASGRLHREPHPTDRRAQILYATRRAHDEIQRVLGAAHQRMLAAAEKLTTAEQLAVVRFLDELSGAMDEPHEATDPPAGTAADGDAVNRAVPLTT
jgi:DNA-binding MarR family transcriptional regulator